MTGAAVVLGVIRINGGATCDEIEEITELSHQTVSARIRDMAAAGLIEDSRRRQPTRSGRRAIVWTLREKAS